MALSRTAFVILLVACGWGCASRQPTPARYVKAAPLDEPVRTPAVIQVPRPLPLPGQLQRVPIFEEDRRGTKRHTWEVIDDANRKAAAGPDRDGYFNAIMTYDFADGALFQVYTAPLRLTAIQLQPGEKIVGKPAAGDTIRWVMGVGRSGADGAEQQHLYVKPTRPGLDTTMVINTDRRTYYLELHSFDETDMAAVRWRYPHDEIAQIESAAAREDALARTTTATSLNLEAINFSYRVTVEKGKPVWTPTQVFDDGRKTFIRFPRAMRNREAPALFVLSSTNETQLVNYRVKNDYYVVDRLIDKAELRVGQKDQEIVHIARVR
jgi:type IV secretion system protein TrbG